jgi:hypothetical protein
LSTDRQPAWLLQFARDTHSQAGEDGVIAKVLEMLPATDRWCVEFGAWDGMFLSNTRNLIENAGYASVQIEGSARKAAELKKNYAQNPKVIALNAFVGMTATDGLDAILAQHPVPLDFDLLSIDVDGNDFHIWKAIERYRPKVVCIEFNPTIPTEVSFVQRADPDVSQGASLRALVELGRAKDYELVSVLPFNALFVDAKYFSRFGIADNSPQALRKDLSQVTYIFSGYDGTVLMTGAQRLPWHELPIKASRVQQLPWFLRRFPANYNVAQMVGYGIVLLLTSPRRVIARIRRRLARGKAF